MSLNVEQGEALLVDKPYGWTSFDVVGKLRTVIRRVTGLKKIKIGHAGTLDPLASGLLIICTGRMTKQIESFQGLEKEYTGTFFLGATTPSFDLETKPDQIFEGTLPDQEQILNTTLPFLGYTDQVPPQFSAVKVDGRRAYKSARKDIPVDIPPRRVYIPAFEITRIALPEADFRVVCSKGTYIRALARDFGNHLGCGAHLTALCRTRIGQFHLRDAFGVEEFEGMLGNRQ
jgi:tRNA pseudouridine55 synthase